MNNKKRIFLTGCSGFIGGYLAKRLKGDFELHGLFLEEKPISAELEITPHWGDITNYSQMVQALKEADPHFIIHLAARTEVEKSFYDPVEFQLTNYNGTVNLIEAAKELKHLELFIFASTAETYGAVPKKLWKPFTELTPQYPNAPYAVAKIACEYYLKYAKRAYNFPYCVLRQSNTYGRKDNDFFVVEQIITQMLKNPKEINLGYREPYRNFLYIDDLIDLYVKILRNVDLARNETFCAGIDNAIQIEELAHLIAKKLNWKGKINWGTKPKRAGEIYYLNLSYEKAYRILNWSPETFLSDGLDKTIKIWKQNLKL